MVKTTSIEHFWIGAHPYFSPYLIVCPRQQDTQGEVTVDFFDVDGELFNSAKIMIKSDRIQCLSLEHFLSSCKVESGVKHCHIRTTSSVENVQIRCRLHSHEHSNMTSQAQLLSETVPVFFPIILEEGTSNLVAFMNTSDQDTTVKARLYIGNRSPEQLITLPPHGTRLVHIEATFAEVSSVENAVQGYIRLSSKSATSVGVQVLTKELSIKDQPHFSALV